MSQKPKHNILSVRFNQDNSCVTVATTKGYRIYNCNPFAKCYDSNEGGMAVVEMLFLTSLVALVGAGEQPSFSPRCVRLYNTKVRKKILELNFVTTVLNVLMNKSRLAVVLETKIHLFDLKTMKVLHTLDTPHNPQGVCALSPSVITVI
jgi:autophagy-related protein 18